MTTSSKDDDAGELDDPALRSMRAVWISMRDEEPPSAGLVELLAAARAKAEQLRPREPWWQRALAGLRRPPALALATVLVLLGGAIVIGSRREAFEVRPTIEARGRDGAGGAAKLEAPAVGARNDERAKDTAEGDAATAEVAATADVAPGAGSAASRPAADVGASEGAAAAPSVVAEEQPPSMARPEGRAPRSGLIVAPAGAGAGAGGKARAASADQRRHAGEHVEIERVAPELPAATPVPQAAPPPPPPPPPPAPAPTPASKGGRAPKQDLQIADDAGGAGEAPAVAPGAPTSAAPGPSSGNFGISQEASRPRGPTAAQLARQSDAAAARGDCPAVRAIEGQIRKLDAAFQKAHVERNAAVKRCLK